MQQFEFTDVYTLNGNKKQKQNIWTVLFIIDLGSQKKNI